MLNVAKNWLKQKKIQKMIFNIFCGIFCKTMTKYVYTVGRRRYWAQRKT